ncbi:MAG: recombinase family protein [Bacteroidales bacterium]|nr:recombinase family protein [Bacteroidales bacterium]
MVYAYIRVSTAEQSCSSQQYEIRKWATATGQTIDRWESESVSGTIVPGKRKLGRMIRRLKRGDLIVCTEISRLGRNMLMIMSILNDCAAKGIRIHTIKDNFSLDNDLNSKIIAFAFALAAEIERNLISQRTREALAELKASGVRLGRPAGSYKRRCEVMRDLPRIIELRAAGFSYPAIAKRYGIHRNTLVNYLKSNDCLSGAGM